MGDGNDLTLVDFDQLQTASDEDAEFATDLVTTYTDNIAERLGLLDRMIEQGSAEQARYERRTVLRVQVLASVPCVNGHLPSNFEAQAQANDLAKSKQTATQLMGSVLSGSPASGKSRERPFS